MKWLILLSLFACSTQKAPEPSTESDAKQVSASEVQSCLCNKIYMPVCADGISYGNECEAQCHGHKKWTDGSCPKK